MRTDNFFLSLKPPRTEVEIEIGWAIPYDKSVAEVYYRSPNVNFHGGFNIPDREFTITEGDIPEDKFQAIRALLCQATLSLINCKTVELPLGLYEPELFIIFGEPRGFFTVCKLNGGVFIRGVVGPKGPAPLLEYTRKWRAYQFKRWFKRIIDCASEVVRNYT